jgi:hypothetical protein
VRRAARAVREPLDVQGANHHPSAGSDRLDLEPGEDAVRMRKQSPLDLSYLRALQASLSEWDSAEDAAAYDDL